jgi:hypothetical protein
MAKIQNQKILIWCKNLKSLNSTVMDALHLASALELEVCLFGNYHNKKQHEKLQKTIQFYSTLISKNVPSASLSVLLLEGKLQYLVHSLGEEYNAVLFCAGPKMNIEIWNAFYRSKFPFFFSDGNLPNTEKKFKQVTVPVDFRNSTKDAILWSTYFARFNNSAVKLLAANDKNNHKEANHVNDNLESAFKLFSAFNYTPKVEYGEKSSYGIHKEALNQHNDLLIFAASANVTLPDKIFGTFEKKIINRGAKAVLLTNPRKEVYVLCD